MNPADISWLTTSEAAAHIDQARSDLAAGTNSLTVLDRLRARVSPVHARAILTLLEGRAAARAKFEDADHLYFDRAAAEQATAERISRHIAARFEGAHRIADLGSGAGADTLALLEQAPVLAVDHDAARLAMLRANAAVRGSDDRLETLEADLTSIALPAEIDAIWLDPGRRDARGRVLDPDRWSPPLPVALELGRRVPRAGIKVAPGIDLTHVPPDAEIEFVSLDGSLGVAVIWLGSAVATPRRATVLPSGNTLATPEDPPVAEVHPPGVCLYDPDPSIGRAQLIGTLAQQLDAWQLDRSLAYLSSDEAHDTPFARRFRIERWLPFSERQLLNALRDLDAARVEVMRRGSPVDTNALERRLNRTLHNGTRVLTIALTRSAGEHIAIICQRDGVTLERGAS